MTKIGNCYHYLVNPVQFVRKKLPQQLDLDKFVRQLKTKVIHDYKIPLSMKELKAEYTAIAQFFGDIYKYKQKGICRKLWKRQHSIQKHV